MLRHTSIFLSLLVPGTAAGIPAAEIIEEKVHLRSAVYIRIEGLHTSQDLFLELTWSKSRNTHCTRAGVI